MAAQALSFNGSMAPAITGQYVPIVNGRRMAAGIPEVYIANLLKCRPPGNRTPQPGEISNCREFLQRQIELVRPKAICTLGGCAAQNLLGTSESIGRLRGRLHDYRGIPVLCTYHPAFLLPGRSPEKKKDVVDDLKMLLRRLGRPVTR